MLSCPENKQVCVHFRAVSEGSCATQIMRPVPPCSSQNWGWGLGRPSLFRRWAGGRPGPQGGGPEVRASILQAQGTLWTPPACRLHQMPSCRASRAFHPLPPLAARAKAKLRTTGGGTSPVIPHAPADLHPGQAAPGPAQEEASAAARHLSAPSRSRAVF